MKTHTIFCSQGTSKKKTFEVIATEMKYSWRQVVRLHGTALKQFEKKYGEGYLNEQCH